MNDLNIDYPLVGEKTELAEEILFEYQLQIIEDNNFPLIKKRVLFLIKAIKWIKNLTIKT